MAANAAALPHSGLNSDVEVSLGEDCCCNFKKCKDCRRLFTSHGDDMLFGPTGA